MSGDKLRRADSRLDPALAAARRIGGWGLLFSGCVTILYLAPSLFMMQVYDRVLVSQSVATLLLLSLILVCAIATLVVLDGLRTRLLARISLRFERLIAPLLLEAGLKADRQGQGSQARHVLREFDVLRQGLAGPAMLSLFDVIWSPIYFLICFLIHPWLGGLVTAGACLLLFLALLNERALRRSMDELNEILPAASASQDAEAGAQDAIGVLGMRPALVKRQLRRRSLLNEAQKHALFGSVAFTTFVKFTRLVLQSAILGFGAYLALEAAITPGALIAASIIGGRALSPIEQVVAAWRGLAQMQRAFASVREVLDGDKSATQEIELPRPQGHLRFEKVFVRTGPQDKWILSGISFSMRPGEVLGVLGHSGVGKSTLARVAVGALRPEGGAVRLDEANLRDWDQNKLGAFVGYLPQDLCLIEGSIAENIRRFAERTEANAHELDAATIAAARAARAHDMIMGLPGGYGAKLGPFGRGLSMGQSQRVALARALFGAPRFIVLDEPNAHLDAEGEAALVAALTEARGRGAGVLVVAHRAGVMAIADRLMVLNNGIIETIGSREEVSRKIADQRAVQQNNLASLRPREAQA